MIAQEVIERCRSAKRLIPVVIEGQEYYLAIAHPRMYYLLKVAVAKDKYRHERWVERYNRWRRSRWEGANPNE